MATYEPAELARELGYSNEQRPGKVVRDYLRKKYPDHPKYQRWVLDELQADDVRINVPRKRYLFAPDNRSSLHLALTRLSEVGTSTLGGGIL